MTVLEWLLDSDPAIRWQVLRDLVHAPAEVVEAERARTPVQGWGARLLELQGEDGQWAGGACFPARSFNWREENQGQPWISTLPTLQLLHDLGVDPRYDRIQRAVALVKDHCRWEHAGQPFFSGEVEPCINGRTVWSSACFGSNWKMAGGTARRRMVPSVHRSRRPSTSWKDCWRTSTQPEALRNPLRHGVAGKSIYSNEGCFDAGVQARLSTRNGCNSRFRSAGTTTCCVLSSTFARLEMRRIRAWTKRSICFEPSASPTASGFWRTRIPAGSTLHSKTATTGPVDGTRFGQCVCSTGTRIPLISRAR